MLPKSFFFNFSMGTDMAISFFDIEKASTIAIAIVGRDKKIVIVNRKKYFVFCEHPYYFYQLYRYSYCIKYRFKDVPLTKILFVPLKCKIINNYGALQ